MEKECPNKFFTDFQEYLLKEHRYSMDKLNPTQNFWWYHPLKQEKIFREIGYHSYHEHYAKRFDPIRKDVKKILEIGVFRGHSMLMWEKYFPNAQIYGVDIDYSPHNFGVNAYELCKDKKRIHLFKMDACKEENVFNLMKTIGEDVDIIIDDGSHHPMHQLISLVSYTDYLKPNGYFVVEDVFMHKMFDNSFLDYFDEPLKLFRRDKFFFDEIIENKFFPFRTNYFTHWEGANFKSIVKNWDIEICPPKDYVLNFEDINLKGDSKKEHYNNRQGIIFFKKPNQ